MAITKINCLKASHGKDSHAQSTSLRRCLDYIINEKKTDNYYYVSGYNCSYQTAYQEMMSVKLLNNKTWGRQGYHFVISFSPEDHVDEEIAFEIMNEFCFRYLKKEYQGVFSIHNDQNHLHGHLVFNSVNMMTGLKYRYEKGDWKKYIQPIVNDLCDQYNLSTISLDTEHSDLGLGKEDLSYEQWKAKKNNTKSWGDIYREDIDRAILKVNSFDEFIDVMISHDYEIKNTGKYFGIRTKTVGDEREHKFRRIYRLGDDYSVDAIKRRIAENVKRENEILYQSGEPVDEKERKKLYSIYVAPTVISCKINVKSNGGFNYREYQSINPLKSSFVKRLYMLGCFRKGKSTYSDKQMRYDLKHINELNQSVSYICKNKIKSIEELNHRIEVLNGTKKRLYRKKKELLKLKANLKEGEPDIYKGKILNITREIDKQLKEVKICLRIQQEYENRKRGLSK